MEKIKLKDILAISGQPGLYRYVAQSSNGIIVESLADGRRLNTLATAKVSSMGEIAIYTDGEDAPLSTIFESIFAKNGGKETISTKSTPEQMKALFAEVFPSFDRERVHISDMKKIISWYNILVAYGMTDFSIEDEAEAETEAEPKPEAEAETEAKTKPKATTTTTTTTTK